MALLNPRANRGIRAHELEAAREKKEWNQIVNMARMRLDIAEECRQLAVDISIKRGHSKPGDINARDVALIQQALQQAALSDARAKLRKT